MGRGPRDVLGRSDELEAGQRYYVLITTASGLYRYFMNDLLEVTGFFHRTPLLRFVQKGKGVTNLTGEKLYEAQMIESVSTRRGAARLRLELLHDGRRRASGRLPTLRRAGRARSRRDAATIADADRRSAWRAEHRVPRQARPAAGSGRLSCRVAAARHRRSVQDGVRPRRPARGSVQAGRAAIPEGSAVRRSTSTLLAEQHDQHPRIRSSLRRLRRRSRFRSRWLSATRRPSDPKPRRSGPKWRRHRASSGYGESCPREYVTGESLDDRAAFCARHEATLRERRRRSRLRFARGWRSHADEIDANPAAWCAHRAGDPRRAWRRTTAQTVEAFLSLPAARRTLPVHRGARGRAAERCSRRPRISIGGFGFTRLQGEAVGRPRARSREDWRVLRGARIGRDPRARGREQSLAHGADEAIRHSCARSITRSSRVEEPLAPNRYDELARDRRTRSAARSSWTRACCGPSSSTRCPAPIRTRWLINVRVSKMGGLLRSLDVVDAARDRAASASSSAPRSAKRACSRALR